jgi:transposase InsO family protein
MTRCRASTAVVARVGCRRQPIPLQATPPALLAGTGATNPLPRLTDNAIAISMDGKGAWRDNVFVERLWRSVKYEEVYLRAYDSVGEARTSIGRYLDFYNRRRPHSSLDGRTPDRAYFEPLPIRMAA